MVGVECFMIPILKLRAQFITIFLVNSYPIANHFLSLNPSLMITFRVALVACIRVGGCAPFFGSKFPLRLWSHLIHCGCQVGRIEGKSIDFTMSRLQRDDDMKVLMTGNTFSRRHFILCRVVGYVLHINMWGKLLGYDFEREKLMMWHKQRTSLDVRTHVNYRCTFIMCMYVPYFCTYVWYHCNALIERLYHTS